MFITLWQLHVACVVHRLISRSLFRGAAHPAEPLLALVHVLFDLFLVVFTFGSYLLWAVFGIVVGIVFGMCSAFGLIFGTVISLVCSTSWLCPWHCLFVIGFLGQYSASLLGAWEAQQDSLGSSCEVLAAPAGVLPRGFLGGSRGCCGDALGFGSRWGANWEAVRTHQGSPTH